MARLNHLANVLVSQLNTVIVMAGSFVVTPAILYGLGDARYGGWLLISSFIHYLRFLDLGTTAGTTKFGAAALERDDKSELKRVLDTSAGIFVVLAFAVLAATAALDLVLPRAYPTLLEGHRVTIAILGFAVALDMAFRPFAASLRMRSLFYVHDGIETFTYSIFKLGLVLYFAYDRTLSYRVLAYLHFGETVTRLLCVFVASFLLVPASRRMNPFRPVLGMAKQLAGMGAAVTVINVADLVRFQLDAGVIGYFMPDDAVGISIFGVGTRLPTVVASGIGVIGSVLMPRFSGLSATGDQDQLVSLLRRASLSTGLVASLILVNLAVLGPQFLMLWLHKPWVAISGHILLIMLPAYYIALLAGPSTSMLLGRGKLRGLTMLTVAEAVTNLGLSIALVKPFGLYGVALGTAIPMAFFRGVVFPLLLDKEINLSPLTYLRMHGRAVSLGLVYLIVLAPLTLVKLPSYLRFVGLGAGTVVVFVALLLVFVPDVRAEVRRRFRARAAVAGS